MLKKSCKPGGRRLSESSLKDFQSLSEKTWDRVSLRKGVLIKVLKNCRSKALKNKDREKWQ
jgi:hypothetical protein